mmetsp:Transcript_17284/g.49511  ORF Transcript_17284/g.49511 Transcript_17284/m.49511 type:complete len:266 (-) Transcript_17284:44-841(-)
MASGAGWVQRDKSKGCIFFGCTRVATPSFAICVNNFGQQTGISRRGVAVSSLNIRRSLIPQPSLDGQLRQWCHIALVHASTAVGQSWQCIGAFHNSGIINPILDPRRGMAELQQSNGWCVGPELIDQTLGKVPAGTAVLHKVRPRIARLGPLHASAGNIIDGTSFSNPAGSQTLVPNVCVAPVLHPLIAGIARKSVFQGYGHVLLSQTHPNVTKFHIVDRHHLGPFRLFLLQTARFAPRIDGIRMRGRGRLLEGVDDVGRRADGR